MRPSPAKPALKLVGIPGSLRRRSVNRALLEHLGAELGPASSFSVLPLALDLPQFNEDVEQAGFPAEVATLCRRISEADGVVFATPEYNQSVPGPLKNAIDWLSRGPDAPLRGKPVGVLGASAGPGGTRMAQAHTRYVLAACGSIVMASPQIYFGAHQSIFRDGELISREHVAQLSRFSEAFVAWVQLFTRNNASN